MYWAFEMKLCFDMIGLGRLTDSGMGRQFLVKPSKARSRIINPSANIFTLYVDSYALSRSILPGQSFRVLEHLKQELDSMTRWHLPRPHHLHHHKIRLFHLLHVVHRQRSLLHSSWKTCPMFVLALSQCLPKVL